MALGGSAAIIDGSVSPTKLQVLEFCLVCPKLAPTIGASIIPGPHPVHISNLRRPS